MRRLLTLHRGFDIRLGGSAVIDQAVVSGTNFLITVIVGRLCGPTELGLFALVTTIWYFVLAFLESAIASPFAVFVHRLADQERSAYAGSAIAHVIGLSSIATAVIGLLTVLLYWLGYTQLALVLAALTVTIPCRLLRQFARRFHYATLNLNGALALDVAVATLEIASLALFYFMGSLSAAVAFLGVGCAHTVVLSVWLIWYRNLFRIERAMVIVHLLKNWALGRWLVASQITMIVGGFSLPWIIAWMLDESQTGIYFSCGTLVQIGAPLTVAVQNVLSPRSATAFSESGLEGLRRVVRRATVGLVVGMGLFSSLVAFAGHYLVAFFFGSAYAGQDTVVALLAMSQLAYASTMGAATGLTVLERAELLFRSQLIGILVTVTLACVLIGRLGLPGAAIAQFAGTFAGSMITILYYRRVVRQYQESALAKQQNPGHRLSVGRLAMGRSEE